MAGLGSQVVGRSMFETIICVVVFERPLQG